MRVFFANLLKNAKISAKMKNVRTLKYDPEASFYYFFMKPSSRESWESTMYAPKKCTQKVHAMHAENGLSENQFFAILAKSARSARIKISESYFFAYPDIFPNFGPPTTIPSGYTWLEYHPLKENTYVFPKN